MNRFKKYLATAALLVLPILAACGEDPVPPPATGSIMGQVSIEGMGIDGVSVNLSNGASTTTAGGGTYRFDGVEAGAYTVTISGFPADASFDATSAAATIPETGGSVTLDFRGSYIRTASIMGTVTVENTGIGGITVRLSGMADSQTATDNNGQYAFTGLRAGSYSVEISGFDMDEVGFGNTSSAATVGVGESKIISFDGTYLRTAGIEGRVSIEGEGLSGVTVSLGGSESGTTTTDAGGRYAFAKLKAGVYTVAISGYDADDYQFESTSESVTLATGETANVPFEGTLLRTAGISGRVSVGGMGMAGVTVSLSGMDDPREATTNAQGQYGFAGLAEGTYVLSMTNPDAAEYSFETERSVTLARSESKIENFEGTSLRTAGVAGRVTVEESGVAGVTVTLIRVTGATSGDVIGIKQTGDDGSYAFGDLLAGIYRVDIAGFDAEYAFETTNWQGQVPTGDVADASFAGTIIRTASIGGMVTVEGSGKEGVTVSLAGGTDGVDDTAMTGADGGYMFDGLRRGDYTVTITNPDEALYSFTATERKVSMGVGQAQGDVSFAGTMLRQGSISGRVHAEGTAIVGATVTLAGAMEATRETDDQGNYAFTDLGPGTYVVSVTNPDEVAYDAPESTSENVTLDSADGKETVNFAFTHTRDASVTGKAFVDEAARDGMYTANEPALEGMEIPLTLQGPDVNREVDGKIGMDGSYAFEGLRAGTYRVLVDLTTEVRDGLEEAGYEFAGDVVGDQVTVAAGGTETVNFPFHITIQTINVGAVMGNDKVTEAAVKGVELALYPTAQDADDDMNMLGEAMMTGDDGMATFDFAREADSGPGSEESDNLVFVKVVETGHDDLMVSDNDIIEIEYPGIARVHAAPARVRLLNVAVNVDFWVKSNATARSGDMGLGDWTTEVFMGDPDAEDAMALMKPDPDDETEMVNLTEPTDTATAMDNKYLGKGTFSYRTVDEDGMPAVPATFYVRVDSAKDQAADGGEMFDAEADEVHAMGSEDGKSLMYEHTGLELPSDMNVDVGPMRITFTTQSLRVSIHRELDDVAGFTDFRAPEGGDGPALGLALKGLEVELLEIGSDGRARTYEYMLADGKTEAPNPLAFKTSRERHTSATFKNLPADGNFIVELNTGSGLTVASNYRDGNEAFAHGSALDDYGESAGELNSAGYVAGGFGEGVGGARHTVELCHLARVYDDMDFGCSTFAYKWNDGSVSGAVTGLRKGDEATITLTPEGDFASEFDQKTTVKATTTTNSYSFSNVADGEYVVILEGSDGRWKEVEKSGVGVAHMTAKEAESSKGANAVLLPLDATELRFVVKGVVANDEDMNEVVTGDEAIEGIVMEIYNTSLTRSGANAGRSRGAAALDEDGNPRTTVTDSDGNYSFTELAEGIYIVQAKASDDYEVLRNGNRGFKASTGAKKVDAVTGMALVTASPPPPEDTEAADPAAPYWNHNTSTLHTADGPDVGDFALLYKDGRIDGLVMDPSAGAKDAYADTRVRLRRCLTYTGLADGAAVDDNCDEYDGPGTFVDVSAKGAWATPRDLREGIYVVALDLPVGYDNVMGTTGLDAAERRASGNRTAVVELTEGRRSSKSTAAFWIRNSLTNEGVAAPAATVTYGAAKTAVPAGGFITYDVSSVALTLTLPPAVAEGASSKGATMKVGTSSFADGVAKSLAVRSAGTFHVNVAVTSEDGYASALYSSTGVGATEGATGPAVFTFVKDANTRLRQLKVGWVGDGITKSRAQLAGQSGFLPEEERRSAEIAGTALIGLTITQIDDIVLPKGTMGSVTIAATALEAVAAAVTVTTEGITDNAFTAPEAGAPAVTVDIRITDAVVVADRTPQNTRLYRVKISVAR